MCMTCAQLSKEFVATWGFQCNMRIWTTFNYVDSIENLTRTGLPDGFVYHTMD